MNKIIYGLSYLLSGWQTKPMKKSRRNELIFLAALVIGLWLVVTPSYDPWADCLWLAATMRSLVSR